MTVLSSDTIWRDYVTDGVPGSGAHQPDKAEIREWANAYLAATFKSRAFVETIEVGVSVQVIHTDGLAAPGDGGGAAHKRMSLADITSAGYPSLAYFRSVDRYMPDGSTDATNGGYWVIDTNQILNPKMFEAVGDEDGTGSGTDDTAAFDAAFALSELVYIPVGGYKVTKTYADESMFGPGLLYINGTELMGKRLRVGISDPGGTYNVPRGVVIGAEGPGPNGIELNSQHSAWMQFQPTRDGDECQIQLYGMGTAGIGEAQSGTDEVQVSYAGFPAASEDLMEVGDYISFAGTEYLIDTITFSGGVLQSFTVTTLASGAVSFGSTFTDTFYHQYQWSVGTCDTSGTAVTWKSGDYFNQGSSVSGQSKIKINGTAYTVSSITNFKNLVIGSSAGTQTDVAFVQKDLALSKHMTLLRMQTLKGSHEETLAVYQRLDGDFYFQSQYAGSGKVRAIKFRTDVDLQESSTEKDHLTVESGGKVAIGVPIIDTEAKLEVSRRHPTAQTTDGTSDKTIATFGANFDEANGRYLNIEVRNNYRGPYIQGLQAGGSAADWALNPDGGNVAIGTHNDVSNTLHVQGDFYATSVINAGTTINLAADKATGGGAMARIGWGSGDKFFMAPTDQAGDFDYTKEFLFNWSGNAKWTAEGGFVVQGGDLDVAGHVLPVTDNTYDLGSASLRFDDVYATNSTIQTSDAREKKLLGPLSPQELAVAQRIAGLIQTFKWLSAIAEKGEDKARIHISPTSQAVRDAFSSEGLDPSNYGMFVATPKFKREVVKQEIQVEVQPEVTKEIEVDGKLQTNVVQEALYETVVKEHFVDVPVLDENGNQEFIYGLRPTELAMFLAAAALTRLDQQEARIAALESAA